MKIKRRKRIKKEKTVFLTEFPEENNIDLSGLIRYCRENLIPLVNIPEKIAKQFRI